VADPSHGPPVSSPVYRRVETAPQRIEDGIYHIKTTPQVGFRDIFASGRIHFRHTVWGEEGLASSFQEHVRRNPNSTRATRAELYSQTWGFNFDADQQQVVQELLQSEDTTVQCYNCYAYLKVSVRFDFNWGFAHIKVLQVICFFFFCCCFFNQFLV
jgi:hypothetical protein